MATSDQRKSLLTSKLDFESVDGGVKLTGKASSGVSDDSLDEWGFDLDPVKAEAREAAKAAKTFSPPPITLGRPASRTTSGSAKTAPPPVRRKAVTPRKKDNFAQYAASIILLAFIAITVIIYNYVSGAPANSAEISYAVLPEAVVNIDGQVTRMQVTIQVDMEDQQWLQENKKELNNIFQAEVSKTNPEELRTSEGFLEMQNNLKKQLNAGMKTDKVQAVLLTELLLQDKS